MSLSYLIVRGLSLELMYRLDICHVGRNGLTVIESGQLQVMTSRSLRHTGLARSVLVGLAMILQGHQY